MQLNTEYFNPKIHTVVWSPQPGPQEAILTCPCDDILLGGGKGGGKSDSILGEFALHAQQYAAAARGLVIRKELRQLRDLIARSKELYYQIGAKYNGSDDEWSFPNGATLMFGCISQDSDFQKYQGFSRTRIYVEELGSFANPDPLDNLKGSLRTSSGAKCKFIATANFIGAGVDWVRKRYVIPAPVGWTPIPFTFKHEGMEITKYRIWIPSTYRNNKYTNTPEYVGQIMQMGSPLLVRALLNGDPTIIEGQYFPEFEIKTHVISYFRPPDYWTRIHCMDWGGASPWAHLWMTIVPEDAAIPEPIKLGASSEYNVNRYKGNFRKGTVIVYREDYIAQIDLNGNHMNKGLNLDAHTVAKRILDLENGEKITYRVAGTDLWTTRSGPSIATRMAEQPYNLRFRKALTERTSATAGAHNIGGLDNCRAHLVGQDGIPNVFITENCANLIDEIRLAQHDPDNPEEKLKGKDHALDAWRYGLQSFYKPPIGERTSNRDYWDNDKLIDNWKSGTASVNDKMYSYGPGLDGLKPEYGIKFTPATRLK